MLAYFISCSVFKSKMLEKLYFRIIQVEFADKINLNVWNLEQNKKKNVVFATLRMFWFYFSSTTISNAAYLLKRQPKISQPIATCWEVSV